MRLLAALLALVAACDPPVRSESAGVAVGSSRLSRELESCARTADCGEDLRCVAATCTPEKTSGVGEYLWASGRRLARGGAVAAALEALHKASAQYEADKLPIPAGLLCDHGALLARQAGDARAGEQAARLLHRCLLASPPGSAPRERALEEIAALAPRGLDPQLLARDTPADAYLVNAPTPPSPEALKVAVARTTPAGDKGYEGFARLLEGKDARPAVARCWQEQWKKSGKAEWSVALPLKLRARLDGDDEYAGGTLELGGDDPGVACLRTALAPLVADFVKSGSSGSWQGTVTLSAATDSR